jgi:hypothetical protein
VPPSDAGLFRRVLVFAIVAAPAFFLADNLLHPKEYARGNEADQLEAIADAYQRWQLAHVLGLISVVLFLGVVLGLAYLVSRRRRTLGLAGGALGLIGLVGFGAVLTIDGFSWGILGEVSAKADAATAQLALEDMQESEWGLPYYLLTVAFGVGMLALLYGAVRDGALPLPAAALFALGVLMVGTETAIISNAYFIAGAAVLLAGGIAVAVHVSRMTDDAFEAGGGAPA